MTELKCNHLSDFMKVQMEIIKKHLAEHAYLRKMQSKTDALDSFIEDYGWLMREMHCTQVCKFRENCEIAAELSSSGDLLSKRVENKKKD